MMKDCLDNRHRRLAIAPMMELTDRHYRHLVRLLTRHTLLYTEMLTCGALVNGDRAYLLGHNARESPLVLQLGGSDPAEMARAAAIGADWGYDEINMNVGCPSDRVQAGRFGACLMAEPTLVRDVVSAMRLAVDIPVSVKCRLGIDRDDSYAAVHGFVDQLAQAGCEYVIVHARKAWLDGLSPKENREIPPLRYEYVYRLKQDFPHLHISINGGIRTLDEAQRHLQYVDGVMIGRAAYYQPAMLAEADQRLFPDLPGGFNGSATVESLSAVALDYARYMQHWVDRGVRMSVLSRHLLALFQQVPGARLWRRHISEQAGKSNDALALVEAALAHIQASAQRIA